jgi:RimJ/RimL family protein N-acetyltransferase
MTLPTLTTSRLLLRERSLGDIPAYLQMDADPRVMRYVGDGRVPDPAAYAERMKQRIAAGNSDGLGVWSVFERDGAGDFLGCVLLSPVTGLQRIELAYRYCQKAWGRGIAAEAGVPCLAYGFNTLKLGEIVALAYRENLRSQRVIAKLGFAPAGNFLADGIDLLLYRLQREAHLAPCG